MSNIVKNNHFQEQKEYLQILIDSKKLPVHIKTVEDAFVIAEYGRELGFPIIQSFKHIIMIQGTPTLSAKAIGAILRKNNVTYTCTEDAVYVYSDGSVEENSIDKKDIKVIDRRTTVIFTRGSQVEKVTYTQRDATSAGYMEKDNWKRMFKEMAFSRCISKGSNRIGPDLLLGLYSTDEIADSIGVGDAKIVRDPEDGTIIDVIETEYEEIKK